MKAKPQDHDESVRAPDDIEHLIEHWPKRATKAGGLQFSELRHACYDGDVGVVSTWLAGGGHVDSRGEEPKRPSECGPGGDAPSKMMHDKTMLMITSSRGHDLCVSTLLEHNADPNLRDDSDRTAMQIAAQRGHAAVVQLLCLASTETLWNAMADAEARDHTECVAVMREHAVRLQIVARCTPPGARTPLPEAVAIAAVQGATSTMMTWLDAGGHIDAQASSTGCSLLACVCMADTESVEAVNLLISRGAAIDLQNARGKTPLMLSAWSGHALIASRLLAAEAAAEAVAQEAAEAAEASEAAELAATAVEEATEMEVDAAAPCGRAPEEEEVMAALAAAAKAVEESFAAACSEALHEPLPRLSMAPPQSAPPSAPRPPPPPPLSSSDHLTQQLKRADSLVEREESFAAPSQRAA